MLILIKRAELRPLLAKYGPVTVRLYPTWDSGHKILASKVQGCVIKRRIHAIGELGQKSSVIRIYKNRAGVATHSLVVDTKDFPEGLFPGRNEFVY